LMRAQYTVEGIFIDANDIHVQTMGYDKQQMIGKNILEFIPEEEKDYFEYVWNNVVNGESEQTTVKRNNKSTGEELWLLNQYTPVKNEEGQTTRVLYLAIDITEQKQAEQMAADLLIESQKQEFQLSAIITSLDQTLMRARYDKDGIFIDSNEIHRGVMGYQKGDMDGKNILEFIPENEKEEFNQMWQELLQGTPKNITVHRYNKSTGDDIWLLNEYTPILGAKKQVEEILYLGIDITEQKKLEQQTAELLTQSQNKEKSLEGLLHGVDETVMRAEYTPEGELTYANEKHIKTMGYNYQEMLGKNILEFITEEEKETFTQLWNKVKSGEHEKITVKRQNKETGAEIWLLNQYTPILDINNKVEKILYFAIDISEQKRLEQELLVQERIMNQNMEELYEGFEKLEQENERLSELENEITEKFDNKNDKLYNDWLNSFE